MLFMAIAIRPGTADDQEVLARLRFQMDAEENESSASFSEFATVFTGWLGRHGNAWHSFIAEEGGRSVGMLWLAEVPRMPRPTDPSPPAVGYVTAFFVEPRYRNQGVGSALLAAMNDAVDQLPYETLIVWPGEKSASAYLRAGFRLPEELLERVLDC